MAKQNRTEKATPRRRKRAEDEGQVPRSRELSSAVIFAATVILFSFSWSVFFKNAKQLFKDLLLTGISQTTTVANVHALLIKCALGVIRLTGPIVCLTLVVGIAAQLAQVGFKFSAGRLKLHFERFNPARNIGHLFSTAGLVEFIKSSLVFFILAYMSVTVVMEELHMLPSLVLIPIEETFSKFNSIVYRIAIRVSIFLVILAIGDYLFQRYRHEESLKMTKQEVKEDVKDIEGDPRIKSRIRRMQINLMRRRMMAAVPKADVVVTNPTEFAVALVYNIDSMDAPQVVAKGRDYLARKIREIAEANKVPIVENPPVARALYKSVEVGQRIPFSLYKAVAEILAFVYKAKSTQL